MAKKLISFDLQGDFGFFRKPDVNDGIQLSYNLIHKPSVLGVLGAILGLEGYRNKGVWPEYYRKLHDLPIGLMPVGAHERGNFQKTLVTYTNTVGYANLDGNLIVRESMLIAPAYRIFLLLDDEDKTHNALLARIINGQSVYVPYFGKNEFAVWWDTRSVHHYDFSEYFPSGDFVISSVFLKNDQAVAAQKRKDYLESIFGPEQFAYFERLPVGFNEDLGQYQMADFAFTNWTIKAGSDIKGLYRIETEEGAIIIQLF